MKGTGTHQWGCQSHKGEWQCLVGQGWVSIVQPTNPLLQWPYNSQASLRRGHDNHLCIVTI